jgi:L-lactate dehydrogenase complex protein LldG
MTVQNKSDLIEQFIQSAKNTTATVERIPANTEVLNASLEKNTEGDELVLLSEPDDLDSRLFGQFILNKKVITHPSAEQLRTIKVGVTDAFCAVASTGSVCVCVSKNLSSPASMLTHKHIVVVDSNSIVPTPRNLFEEEYLDGKGLKRSFSFITGPSATADMGPLVRGVHGPGILHIIILE